MLALGEKVLGMRHGPMLKGFQIEQDISSGVLKDQDALIG